MEIFLHQNYSRAVLRSQRLRQTGAAGNVLIYIVVLMLIFGTLGVAMVSLFSTSTASTATRNDTRRAIYMAESGMRYANSELRNNDFSENTIDTLNTTTYNVTDAGSFTINIFSPWFSANGATNNSGAGELPLLVPIGTVPDGPFIPYLPSDKIYAVNFEFVGFNPPEGGSAAISSIKLPVRPPPPDTLTFNLNDDFYASDGERIAFAVQPLTDQTVTEGGNLDLPLEALYYLPKFGGAINIRRNDYFYEERKEVPEGSPTKVVLTNISKRPEAASSLPVTAANDWVIFSPRNFLVVPTGESNGVEYGGDYLFGKIIYDASLIQPGAAPPDITADDLTSNLSEQESDTGFFGVDENIDELYIGGNQTDQFGSAFYNATRNIGGERDYCAQGACLFALGVRVFFLVDFASQGEGITFTLLGQGLSEPLNNSATSVGGDADLSELMGYAGDSRLVPNASDVNDFVATDSNDRGLDPPKIAVELDTQTNEPTFNFCSGTTANPNTRNDPVPEANDSQDVVQYVFWGREDLSLSCRNDFTPVNQMSTYDDNRHNPDDWIASTGDDVRSSPAVADDGTIYVGSNDGKVYAFNPDGTDKGEFWPFTTGGSVQSSPAVNKSDGTIYVGSDDFNVYAINPNGTQKWQFSTLGQVRSSPAVVEEDDGTATIYIGSDDGNMYALVDDGSSTVGQRPGWPFNAGATFSFGSPAIGPEPEGIIYFSARNATLYARFPDGTEKFTFDLGDNNIYMPGIDRSGGPNDGTVYSDIAGDSLVAIDPSGGQKWTFSMGADIDSTPVVGQDGRIYFGTDITDDGKYPLFAVDPDARAGNNSSSFPVTAAGEWEFLTGNQVDNTPALNSDDSEVYVVSMDGNLYAVDTADGSEISRFPIPVTPTADSSALPNSSPAVGPDGTVYVGSTDNNLYAVGRIVEPSNIKNKYITSTKDGTNNRVAGQLVDVGSRINWLNGDSSDQKRWAVRLEVDRIGSDYTLSLWIRQCDNSICDNVLGTFFQDTRVDYEYSAVPDDLPLQQTFTLNDPLNNPGFQSFFFGFTGAAGATALDATISEFQLSFIRPGDSVIICDSINWPVEPPLTDCVPPL
jgi:outer membrane protein assembly factor BamB